MAKEGDVIMIEGDGIVEEMDERKNTRSALSLRSKSK